MAPKSASEPHEMLPAVLTRPASIFACLNHLLCCAYSMYSVSVYYCALHAGLFVLLNYLCPVFEWIATLMAFSACHSFDGVYLWNVKSMLWGSLCLHILHLIMKIPSEVTAMWSLAFCAALRDTDTSLTSWLCVRRSSHLLNLVCFSKASGVLLECPSSGMCLPSFHIVNSKYWSQDPISHLHIQDGCFSIIRHCGLSEAQCRCLAPSCWNILSLILEYLVRVGMMLVIKQFPL